MAGGHAPRVAETVIVTGTGPVTLSGTALFSFQTWFAGLGASGVTGVGYCIVDNITGAWESGNGNFNGGNPGTLTRTFVDSSTNAQISFAGNSCTVTCEFIPNAAGYLDISAMPIGPGSANIVPVSGAATLGIVLGGTPTATTQVANRQVFYPFTVTKPLIFNSGGTVAPNIFSQLGARVTTAVSASTFSIGIYLDTANAGGTGNAPTGSPILSVSGLSGAATGIIFGTVAQTSVMLTPGIFYWLSIIPSAAIAFNAVPTSGLIPLGLGAGTLGIIYYLTGTGSTLITPVSGSFTIGSGTYPPLIVFA